MFAAKDYPISIAETSPFYRKAQVVFSEDERTALVDFLAWNPEGGDVIPGTGGLRKLRWAAKGRGRRAGARVIYYFRDLNMPLYLLAVYTKGERDGMTASEKKALTALVETLVSHHSERLMRIVAAQKEGA